MEAGIARGPCYHIWELVYFYNDQPYGSVANGAKEAWQTINLEGKCLCVTFISLVSILHFRGAFALFILSPRRRDFWQPGSYSRHAWTPFFTLCIVMPSIDFVIKCSSIIPKKNKTPLSPIFKRPQDLSLCGDYAMLWKRYKLVDYLDTMLWVKWYYRDNMCINWTSRTLPRIELPANRSVHIWTKSTYPI